MNAVTIRRLTAAALLVAGLAACGSGSHASSTPVTVFDIAADPGKRLPAGTAAKHAVLSRAALRSGLDTLLSAHATLVAALMHQVGAGQSDTAVALRALEANTDALAKAIALVYGTDGGRAFAQLWEQHTQFFVDYAQAARTHDGGAKREAERELRDYQNDFADFVTTATGGRVPLLAVTNLLHGHVEDLTQYIDADVAGHTDDARRLLDRAVAHMHVIAKAVSDSIVAQHLATVRP